MLMRPTAILLLAITISAGCLAQSAMQPRQPQTSPSGKVDAAQADLHTVVVGLNEDSDTLINLASPLVGTPDADNASSLVSTIQLAMTETAGASWLIEPYNKITCDQDRQMMKGVLQERLAFYSHILDLHIDALSKLLALTRLPAVSQIAIRAQDRVRSAKRDMRSVLDAIQ
jgi:hypothetical protein